MDTKQTLVREALLLFLQRGYDTVTLTEIAARVGITKPAIYYHFRNKEELAEGVLDHFTQVMTAWSRARFGGCTTARELVEAFITSWQDFARVERILTSDETGVDEPGGDEIGADDAGGSFIDFVTSAARSQPRFRQRLGEIFAATRHNLAESFRAGQEAGEIRTDLDPDLAALHLHALIEGMSFLDGFGAVPTGPETAAALFTRVWEGLQA